MSANSPLEFLFTNATRAPFLIVYIVGLVMALVLWRRHPRVSLLSAIAFAMLLVSTILNGVYMWYVLRSDSAPELSRGTLLAVGNFAFTLLNVGAWILILIALFCRRQREPGWDRDESEPYGRRFPEPDRPTGPPREDFRR